ncbi:hypothetical protein AB0M47_38520 [Hamadaea sp. NPDC051192]|uniref:hypothetical protein n=1 Tax=Hamadaea sp. NPDC051192 TaxID=3154940 RepID=UPI003444D40D
MLLPRLRVTEADGDSWDDPSEEQLGALVDGLSADRRFLVVERHDRPSAWQHFIQAYREDDGTFRVEFREGGPEAHFEARTPDADQVRLVVTAWAFDLPGWRERLPWQVWREG